jgi:hypothetical protein
MIGATPDITAVTVVRHGVLSLTFADGVTGEVAVLRRGKNGKVRRSLACGCVRTPDRKPRKQAV